MPHAGLLQPQGVDGLQVDVPLLAVPRHEGLGLHPQHLTEGGGHVVVRFKATRPDGGANGGADMGGLSLIHI